mgnify:CR=1 FL=1
MKREITPPSMREASTTRGDTQDRLDALYETFNIRRPDGVFVGASRVRQRIVR